MKMLVASFCLLAVWGCGGASAPVVNSQAVVGKWMLDLGDPVGITPSPTPPVVEFRVDGTYTQVFAGSQIDSTYEIKDGRLTAEAGIGIDLKKQFFPQNDNAGTLRLIEVGPPPAGVDFWRSIN